jgi:hypothetical protein
MEEDANKLIAGRYQNSMEKREDCVSHAYLVGVIGRRVRKFVIGMGGSEQFRERVLSKALRFVRALRLRP